ncbi:MAG: sulfurtransferase [Betaproteobacteria bacterium]|nr:sulfurtransferase [Betaproteobacteria bacterium]
MPATITPYTTLISVDQLRALQSSGAPLMVFDCSFDLTQPAAGRTLFNDSHIAGAVFADLNDDLSTHSPQFTGRAVNGGRHPLPAREDFARWLGQMGFHNGMQAVVYDRHGMNYCGRLWWMLKWLGHDAVAVLNGGWQAWVAAGGAVESGAPGPRVAAHCDLHPALLDFVEAATVQSQLGRASQTVLDARAPARFRGEVEPFDPVAGHIPGALNRPFNQNIGEDGLFKPAEALRAEFAALLGERDAATVVHHCGSGVSAIPNILAMQVAGLGASALFAGSWSEWCSDPQRPVATG